MPVSDSEPEQELSFFDSFFGLEEPSEEDNREQAEKENDGAAEAAVEKHRISAVMQMVLHLMMPMLQRRTKSLRIPL